MYNLQLFGPTKIIYNLHVLTLSDLQSTRKNKGRIDILQFDLTPPLLLGSNQFKNKLLWLGWVATELQIHLFRAVKYSGFPLYFAHFV